MWQSTYRDSSVGGASAIGLIVALLDRLVADLSRAAEAIRNGNIEQRCRETNHALLVLGQLESWLDQNKGGDAARQIAMFYAQIRARLTRASIEQRAELLEEQIGTILDVRTSWQLLDSVPAAQEGRNAVSARAFALADAEQPKAGGGAFSQSA